MPIPDNALGGGPAVPPSQPAPSTGVDTAQFEAELARVRGERDQLAAGLQQLRPYAEDIEWLTQDPENHKFLRESRKAYEDARKSRNQVPDELKPLADQVGELTDFVKDFRRQQQQAAEEPRRRWLSEGKTFCEGLIAKHPQELSRSADPTMAWTGALENICAARGLTWEEGWKILEPAFVKQSSGPPPTSLRADSGFAGLPPPSRPAPTAEGERGKSLGKIVLERMQSMS